MSCQILFYRESEEKKIKNKFVICLYIVISVLKVTKNNNKKKKKKKKKKQYITNAISKKGIHDISCLTTLSIDVDVYEIWKEM